MRIDREDREERHGAIAERWVDEGKEAEGSEESQIIKSKAEKERTVIIADANKKSQTIKGEGDGKAIKVYAEAFNKDKEFFKFYRSMEAYKKVFKEGDDDPTLILSPDSDFFKYFGNQSGK